MNRYAAFEISHVRALLDENQRRLAERGYRWCIVDKELRRICSMHLRQELADRRALALDRRTRRKAS